MELKRIAMGSNFGNEGGGMHLVSTSVSIEESLFARNFAFQGGVIFALQKSTVRVERSWLVQNLATDGSVMVAVANIADDSLHFEDCYFIENYGKSNSIHILLSSMTINNSTFTNNYAQSVTHGVTLISSNLRISNSLIQFERHCHWTWSLSQQAFVEVCGESDFFARLDLRKLDTGFFNLYLTSFAEITGNTTVQHLLAQKQAVASVIG